MAIAKCPRCGSTRTEQDMMPYGPIWCLDCGFRVEDKTAVPNPFLQSVDTARNPAPAGGSPEQRSLGSALYELSKTSRRARATDPPAEGDSSGDTGPAGDEPASH